MAGFKEDLHSIIVLRRFFGFMWFEVAIIQRKMAEDGMELFRSTRDTYRSAHGEDNVKFRIHYRDLILRGNGKQIL